jgi:hypothetical protein
VKLGQKVGGLNMGFWHESILGPIETQPLKDFRPGPFLRDTSFFLNVNHKIYVYIFSYKIYSEADNFFSLGFRKIHTRN